MGRRAIAGAVIAAAGCGGIAWGVVSTQAGCQLQGSCEQATIYVPAIPAGVPTGEGVTQQSLPSARINDLGEWQSGPIEGQWLNFPGSLTYVIYPTLNDGGPFVGPYTFPEVEISPDPMPYTTSFAPPAGNLYEISGLSDGGMNGFTVTNDTCSDYWLWMRVAQENPGGGELASDAATTPDASGSDAGFAADATASDAASGADGAPDAGTD